MKTFIARFSGGVVDADADVGDGQPAPLELGRAPPCELYASLKPISFLEQAIQKYHTCKFPAHVKDQVSFGFPPFFPQDCFNGFDGFCQQNLPVILTCVESRALFPANLSAGSDPRTRRSEESYLAVACSWL